MYSMSKSTERRQAILSFIRERANGGTPPTLAEIAEACGLASRSAAQKHVRALESQGLLEPSGGKARSTRPKVARKPRTDTSTLFEIAPEHVSALTDSDLRALVAKLCGAELAISGHSPDAVIWGGDQRAADGGIDVRVKMHSKAKPPANLPFTLIGFQVKATKMQPSDIRAEMCPGGVLRESIQDLVRAKGAYIIASSENITDGPYGRRIIAMTDAIASDFPDTEIHVDYYDANRLAGWTNRHPGVVAWTRSRIGLALQGWHPYGRWTTSRDANANNFIGDQALRVVDSAAPDDKMALTAALQEIRALLRAGGTSVRIVGLSGVGKTRFAQALFEEDAAPGALPTQLVVYTDTAESPSPAPLSLIDELIANNRRAIVVIDNCSSQLHNQLTSRCKASKHISLLTIEYDIREDRPDETNVFTIESGSSELIMNLISQQYPFVSRVNLDTIARFADGNSRVAIALANTLRQTDSLSGISDELLMDRLFWQGRERDPDLMLAACMCALVYSFDVEDTTGELSQLAALAGTSSLALYRHVDELLRRGLAQKRGQWRAILPHAIANTLADRALSKVPFEHLNSTLINGQGRLLRSFSRRLGYLDRSQRAREIVRNWLGESGLLGDIASLSPSLGEVLQNVAPVDQDASLAAIERTILGPNAESFLSIESSARPRVPRLLRHLAYDRERFSKSADLILRFAMAEPIDHRTDSTRSLLASLFTTHLSGTQATLAQRASWIRKCLAHHNSEVQRIGVQCLSAALEAQHFSSHYGFEFGALVRDYGLRFTAKDITNWYSEFIDIASATGVEPTALGKLAREMLAGKFRALWLNARAADALELAARRLAPLGWEAGWVAVKQTIRFHGEKMPDTIKARLVKVEQLTRPASLLSRIKAFVLGGHGAGLDITDAEDHGVMAYKRADEAARELGQIAALDAPTLTEVLPLLTENVQGRQYLFAVGLAEKTPDLQSTWRVLVETYERTQSDARSVQMLRGFLEGAYARDAALFNLFLDDAFTHDHLLPWIPLLQLSGQLDEEGCRRMLRAMDVPAIPSSSFKYMGHGRATEQIAEELLAGLLTRLSSKAGGLPVALYVLHLHGYDNPNPCGPSLERLALELLGRYEPIRDGDDFDYSLSQLVHRYLTGDKGRESARALLLKFKAGLESYQLSHYDFDQAIAALFAVQPFTALDVMVGDESDEGDTYVMRRGLRAEFRSNALAGVGNEILLQWCALGDSHRWGYVAALVRAFDRDEREVETGMHWSEVALLLLAHAPEPIRVAEALVDRIAPMSWTGSRSRVIEARLPLLDELERSLGPVGATEVSRWRSHFDSMIERERRRELDDHRRENERFE
ncbi:lexA DNA binding domain protein [Lysobacter capsici]|nr:lexA DNA binding domain protein [Lysobacter capsici]